MKVCVDRTRSTLNESMSEKKKFNLTSGSSGSSTCSPLNDNLLADFENTKVPAVVIKKKNRTSVRNKNTLGVSTQCNDKRDSDLIESESLL